MRKLTTLLVVVVFIALFSGCAFPQQVRFALMAEGAGAPAPNRTLPELVMMAHTPDGCPSLEAPSADDSGESEPEEDGRSSGVLPGKPMVALTFDDGPGPYTDQILDLLELHGGRATFFVLGYRVGQWRGTVERMAETGSEVASHSWSHNRLINLSEAEIAHEIRSASEAIRSITGFAPSIYRPPFGQLNDTVEQVSEQIGYSIINWTLDTLDWRYRDADAVYYAIMSRVEDGSIILLHDVHVTTAQAMELVIPRLIAAGYQLVTVSELLTHVYGELEPGRLYGMRQ